MTGRELIMYILENHLEDEEIYKDGKLVGLMTLHEAAEKWNTGVNTVYTWVTLNKIKYVRINNVIYIPTNTKPIINSSVY